MIHELRTYEIENSKRKVFRDRFEKHAMRLMKKHSFVILGVWDEVIGHHQEFHYLLEWKDLNSRQQGWADLGSDQDWIDIKKEYNQKYGEMVRENYSRILKPINFS